MIFEVNDNELVLIAEDAIDVKYLESLFASEVRIVKETDFIRKGFHVTSERELRVKIIKEK